MDVAVADINFDLYKVKAFLDTNIILECLPLAELPWQEIDVNGPILALITPTAMKEIDSKKQDGRIGKRAREFNRLIASVAAGGPPIVIRESLPRVEITLSKANRIRWDEYDDLDAEDGDSRIVAEALQAKGMNENGKLLLSHDIKPIAFASYYDLPTFHVSDTWLRQAEPHPKDREIQRLNQKLNEYQSTEPAFEISIDLIDTEPVKIVNIEDLTDSEHDSILNSISVMNPRMEQSRGLYGIGHYDHGYDEKYEKYQKRVQAFMTNYSRKLEQLFNQTKFSLRVVNTSKIQAENLLIEVNVTNGHVHDRFVFVSPQGPSKPHPDTTPFLIPKAFNSPIAARVGRHEFDYKQQPKYTQGFSVTCEDFRNTQEYLFNGVIGMDARAKEETMISVAITASNLRGAATTSKVIQRKIEKYHVSKLIDLDSLKITASVPMQDSILQGDRKAIDWNTLYEEET